MLSVIIPTKDRFDIVWNSVQQAAIALLGIPSEIIVVNDSKTEQLRFPPLPIIVQEGKVMTAPLTIYHNPKQGVSSARNYGARAAKGELLLFLDDDMLISAENIKTILNFHQNYPNCALNLNWEYPKELKEQIQKKQFGRYLEAFGFTSLKGWRRGQIWNETLFNVDGITSQNLSIPTRLFWKIGGYNESYLFTGEDIDLSRRLREAGVRIFIEPRSVMYHNESDRVELKSFLERRFRGVAALKLAAAKGLSVKIPETTNTRKKIFSFVYNTRGFWFLLLALMPNFKPVDKLYFSIVTILVGAYIQAGVRNTKPLS
jgi:GT2 family glycosyltransferase